MTTPTSTSAGATGIATQDVVDWTDLGKQMLSTPTGKGAAIDCTFVDMAVEVPRDTGPQAATGRAAAAPGGVPAAGRAHEATAAAGRRRSSRPAGPGSAVPAARGPGGLGCPRLE